MSWLAAGATQATPHIPTVMRNFATKNGVAENRTE